MEQRCISGRGIALRLFAVLLLCVAGATAAQAQAVDCSDYPGGIIDGNVEAVSPSNINVDRDCTLRNWPQTKPLTANISFFSSGGSGGGDRHLLVFDNVYHIGQMSCAVVQDHKIWFVNGASTQVQEKCQNLLIPVEKIDKRNPPGDAATVGVPFTYTLVIPVLFDAGTQAVINDQGSLNELHNVIVWDDLNATGVDLTYVSHTAYWRSTGTPVPHTFNNAGGFLTFDIGPNVPAGEQLIIELQVVLEDTPANSVGTQFINTAKWEFGRIVDGEFFEPLPGEWGISDPITIGGPELVLTKNGPGDAGQHAESRRVGRVHDRCAEYWDDRCLGTARCMTGLPNGPTAACAIRCQRF